MRTISIYSDGRTMTTQVVDENGERVPNIKRLIVDFDAEVGIVTGTLFSWASKPLPGQPELLEEPVRIQRLFMEPGPYLVPCHS